MIWGSCIEINRKLIVVVSWISLIHLSQMHLPHSDSQKIQISKETIHLKKKKIKTIEKMMKKENVDK